jgi:hypothetical protein
VPVSDTLVAAVAFHIACYIASLATFERKAASERACQQAHQHVRQDAEVVRYIRTLLSFWLELVRVAPLRAGSLSSRMCSAPAQCSRAVSKQARLDTDSKATLQLA